MLGTLSSMGRNVIVALSAACAAAATFRITRNISTVSKFVERRAPRCRDDAPDHSPDRSVEAARRTSIPRIARSCAVPDTLLQRQSQPVQHVTTLPLHG